MNEKEGKKRAVKLSNCMWCDFFNNSKCDLGVAVKVIKRTTITTKYGAADCAECMKKRKEYNNEKKKIF